MMMRLRGLHLRSAGDELLGCMFFASKHEIGGAKASPILSFLLGHFVVHSLAGSVFYVRFAIMLQIARSGFAGSRWRAL